MSEYLSNIDLNNHKLLNVANGTNLSDGVNLAQARKVSAYGTDTEDYLINKLEEGKSIYFEPNQNGDKIIINTAYDKAVSITTSIAITIDGTTGYDNDILYITPLSNHIDLNIIGSWRNGKKFVIYNVPINSEIINHFDVIVNTGFKSYRISPYNSILLNYDLHKNEFHYSIYQYIVLGKSNENTTESNIIGVSNKDVSKSIIYGNSNRNITNTIIVGNNNSTLNSTDPYKPIISIGKSNSYISGENAIAIGNYIASIDDDSIGIGYKTIAPHKKTIAIGNYSQSRNYNQIVSTGSNNDNPAYNLSNYIEQKFDYIDYNNDTTEARPIIILDSYTNLFDDNYIIGYTNILFNMYIQVNCVIIETPLGMEAEIGKVKAWQGRAVAKLYNNTTTIVNQLMEVIAQESNPELDFITTYLKKIDQNKLQLVVQTAVGTGGWKFRFNGHIRILEVRY